jgi:hypothetical protein
VPVCFLLSTQIDNAGLFARIMVAVLAIACFMVMLAGSLLKNHPANKPSEADIAREKRADELRERVKELLEQKRKGER